MKRLKKIPLRAWLFYLFLISILFTGMTFASYKSESSGGSSTRVALFANDVTLDFTIGNISPGMDPIELPITVMNYDGEKTCEVSQSYVMKAEAFVGRLPIKLEWKSVDTKKMLEGDSVSGNFFISDPKREHQYILVVSWDLDKDQGGNTIYPDSDLADEIEVIRLKVHCEQID